MWAFYSPLMPTRRATPAATTKCNSPTAHLLTTYPAHRGGIRGDLVASPKYLRLHNRTAAVIPDGGLTTTLADADHTFTLLAVTLFLLIHLSA